MAITAETRKSIIELAVAANNAAPGTTLLTSLITASGSGSSLLDIANSLADSASFKATYPTIQTAEEFANRFLGNLIPEASAAAKAEGAAIIVGMINAGSSRGEIILEAATYLAQQDESHPEFGASAALFNNRVAVATYHTVTAEAAAPWSIPSSVTSDSATVATGTAAVDAALAPAPVPTPTFSLAADSASVSEGGTSYFTLTTTNVDAGSEYSYTVSGVSAADLDGGALAGTVKVDAEGKAVIAVTLAADATTEGAESMSLTIAGETASVSVTDSSTTPVVEPAPVATYSLAANAASVDEGGTAYFTLTTTNVDSGSQFSYSISGVSAADVSGGTLVGTATVGADGKAIIAVTLNEDATTEGAETLTLSVAGESAAVTVNDSSATPAPATSFTVTASDIVTSNAIAGANAVTVDAQSSGDNTVTLETDSVTSDGGFIISGDANLTVTAGSSNDTITVVSTGDTSVTTGAGNDTVTIVGNGTNTVNVGAGTDTVTLGNGTNTVIVGSGALGAGDTITGGTGADTVQISGDGNSIGGAGATLAGVENLVLDGTTVTIVEADLEALTSVSGSITTSEITVDTTANSSIDLSGVTLTGIEKITIDNSATLVLNKAQIDQIGAITSAATFNVTIDTDVEGLNALGSKVTAGTGGAVAITVTDTDANILAGAAAIAAAGATAVLSTNQTVAQALSALASNSTVTYNLVDTAENLANASEIVYNTAIKVTATTNATAAQGTQIKALVDASNATTAAAADITAAQLTLNVADTASNIANYYTEGAVAADAVTTSDTSAYAEAFDTYSGNNSAVYSITDTAAVLNAQAAQNTLDNATSITLSDAATVAQVTTINAGSDVDVAVAYALSDTLANVTGAAAALTTNAGNITLTDANITVANAQAVEALSNSGSNSYVLSDAIGTLLAAPAGVVSSASAAATSTATLTVAQANSFVSLFGATVVNDANLDVNDTAANVTGLSAAAIGEARNINISDNATVAQGLAIQSAAGAKFQIGSENVSDTAANVLAATADATNVVVMDDFNSVIISDAATVAQITAIDADLTAETTGAGGLTEVADGYSLTDTQANLIAVNGAGDILDDAGTVTISDASTVAEVVAVYTEMERTNAGNVYGTDLVFSLSDTFANVNGAAGAIKTGATTISISDASLNFANATTAAALAKFDGVYTVSDTVANLFGQTGAAAVTLLNNAASTIVADNVANLEAANGLTAIGLATTDTVQVTDTLANLNTSRTGGTAVTNANTIVISDTDLDVGDATAANALAALANKTVTFNIIDAKADLNTALAATGGGGVNENGEINTLLNNAGTVFVDTDTNTGNGLEALTVAEWDAFDAATTSTVRSALTDTIANVAAGSAALANVVANGDTLTLSDAGGSVAQLTTITDAGAAGVAAINGKNVVDTAANLTAAPAALFTNIGGGSVTVSDNGTVTHTAAVLTKIYGAGGSQYANYVIEDTAANVFANIGTNAGLANFSQGITLTGDDATVAQATRIQSTTTMGSATAYSIEDSSANIAGGAAAALNGAVNLTANDAATVAQASTINAATNSGTTSYAVTDSSANLATAVAASVAGIENATGAVTANNNATAAQADVIAAFTKAVVYSVSDTVVAVSGATAAGLNEAVNIVGTGAGTVAQATVALNATNSGTTTLAGVTDTAANALTLSTGANDVITTLTVSGTTTAADAAAIVALDTGTNITNTVVFANITGSAAELTTLGTAVLAAVTGNVTASAMTIAEYNALDTAVTIGNVDAFSLTDSYTNLTVNSSTAGNVDADTAITNATSTTLTDAYINVAQAAVIDSINTGNIVYSIVDNDANVIAALNGGGASEAALLAATSVTVNGTALDIQTLAAGGTNFIAGTRAEISAMSSVIQGDQVAFEVSVADLVSDQAFYSTLAANQKMTVTDTVANLTGGNALLAAAIHITASDAATVAESTTIRALSAVDDEVTYSLSDSAANLAAAAGGGSPLDAAVNITATDTATFTQANLIGGETNSGTTSYSISDVDTNIGNDTANARNNATDITVTGTTGISAAQATALIGATNSGNTTIALVADTSANLAAVTLGANDTITSLTPNNAATVAQAVAMAAIGTVTAYSLSDTAANLAAADASVLNGATNITATGNSTVAQATVIDAATNSGTTTYDVNDTQANVVAASTTVLANDQNNAVVVDDSTAMTAAQATALSALDTANAGFTIAGAGGVGVYALSDTQANLVATANATVVAASTSVTATDAALTVAEVVALEAAATADATPVSNVSDTYTNIVVNQSGGSAIDLTDVELTTSNTLNIGQAKIIVGYGANSDTYSVSDTAANVNTDRANGAVTGAASVTLSDGATVAQAANIAELANVASYTIADTAANAQAALDTANAASAGDRALVEDAASITLSSNATVAQALGAAAADRGLYTVTGLSFAITDSVANLVAGLAGVDGAGIAAATSINTNSTAAFTVAQAATWTSLSNWVGHDHDTNNATAARYYIADTATNVMAGDVTLVTNATTVVANGTAGNDTINLSMHTTAITIDAGAGVDSITGSAGADSIDVSTGDTGITLAAADTITNFVTGTDKIVNDKETGAAGGVIADGTALGAGGDNGLTTFIAAADTALTAGNNNNDSIYIAYNVAGTGNAYVVIDENDSGGVNAGDTLLVLTGINTVGEIALTDFIV